MRTRARPCNPLLLAAHCADSRCAPPPGRRFGRARPRVTDPRVVTLADGAQTGGRPPPPSLPFPRCADRRPVWAVGPNRPPRPIHPQALRTGAPRVLPRARLPVSYRGHRWGRWLAAGQPGSPPPVAFPPARRSPPPRVLVMRHCRGLGEQSSGRKMGTKKITVSHPKYNRSMPWRDTSKKNALSKNESSL